MSWDPRGATVVVTGAARGIGAAVVRSLYARGTNVVLAGLEPGLLEQRAAEIGPRTLATECDVASAERLDAAVLATIERFGAIDAVVANAGGNAVGTMKGTTADVWERVVGIDLLGVVRAVRAVLPRLVARQGFKGAISALGQAASA